jgi:UDP-glucose 4-epimerase
MKKVLITGGAGFIGSAVAKNLLDKGLHVKIYDIIKPDKKIGEYIRGTIMYPTEIYEAVKDCDYVVHLAAMLGVRRTETDRMGCLDVNIQGTKNVLDACVKANVKKILFGSSSEVYGEPVKNPISESDPVSPKSIYGVTKLAGEEYTKAYNKHHGIDYTIVRFFNVYGPGQVAEFVVPLFVKAVRDNKAPIINGKGDQERCYCHVDDIAEGVSLALLNDASNSETINLGNDLTASTIKDLALRIIRLSGKNLSPQYVDFNHSDRKLEREINYRYTDITKARTLLNYKPRIMLDEGLRMFIDEGKINESFDARYTKY